MSPNVEPILMASPAAAGTALAPIMETAVLVSNPDAVARARVFLRASKAESTLRGYRSDWSHFCAWCVSNGAESLPAVPDTVGVYLSSLADQLKVGSLQRRVNAISQAHQAAGFPSPTHTAIVRGIMRGIRREKGSANVAKDALLTEHIRAMVADCNPDTIIGLRDRTALLLTFGGALRRSEAVALNVEDLAFSEGLVVKLRRSKTDQEGHGQEIVILYGTDAETCPVRTVQLWLERTGITSGPVLRSIRNGQVQARALDAWIIARIVKLHCQAAGVDPAKVSGHSLRSGHATAASLGGCPDGLIQNQLRHARADQTRRYVRVAQRFRQTSSRFLGL